MLGWYARLICSVYTTVSTLYDDHRPLAPENGRHGNLRKAIFEDATNSALDQLCGRHELHIYFDTAIRGKGRQGKKKSTKKKKI